MADLPQPPALAAEYRAGASLNDLAIRYDSSANKIRNILVAQGEPIRPPGMRGGFKGTTATRFVRGYPRQETS